MLGQVHVVTRKVNITHILGSVTVSSFFCRSYLYDGSKYHLILFRLVYTSVFMFDLSGIS